jgi:uncharacterized membrane protein YccC
MGKLGLQDIIDAQPDPPLLRSRRRREVLREVLPWLAFGMYLIAQLWSGGVWIVAREHNDDELARQVEQLRHELLAAASTYVRQDVFGAELRAINVQLESINRKLDRR